MAQLRKAVESFIWAHKTSWIKSNILIKTKNNGGLALPDFIKYLQAVSLIRIIDWYHNAKYKQWVTLEEDIIGLQLKSLKSQFWPAKKKLTLFASSTLWIWDKMLKRGHLSTLIGPMTPLFSNPEFPPALEAINFLKWKRIENVRIV